MVMKVSILFQGMEMTNTVTNTKVKKKTMSDLLGLEEETRRWKNSGEEDVRINILLVFKCNEFIRQALTDEVLKCMPSMGGV